MKRRALLNASAAWSLAQSTQASAADDGSALRIAIISHDTRALAAFARCQGIHGHGRAAAAHGDRISRSCTRGRLPATHALPGQGLCIYGRRGPDRSAESCADQRSLVVAGLAFQLGLYQREFGPGGVRVRDAHRQALGADAELFPCHGRSGRAVRVKARTVVGPLSFSGRLPRRKVCSTPTVGGQWLKNAQGRWVLEVVDNTRSPLIPVTAELTLGQT